VSTPRRQSESDRGATLILLLLFLAVFLGVAALAVDLSALAARGQTLQNTADASALAAVVEYEQQLVTGASQDDARAAAIVVANDVVLLNGVDSSDTDIAVDIEFPAGGGRVTVTIADTDPSSYLGMPGVDTRVDRRATAEFLGCEVCSVQVLIPRPFTEVQATGSGDGYKPIQVGTELYALNRSSASRQIVCVDMLTQDPCWSDPFGDPQVGRDAYYDFNDSTPEMPHTGVVDTRIFWSASDEGTGHRLFCFETALHAPCGTSWQMGDDRRIDAASAAGALLTSVADENRGGGTVEVEGKIYVFTDNHEVHCFDPAINFYCAAFLGSGSQSRDYGGRPTGLDVFPDNRPQDGNHGSSIDRIVDPNNGYIYSTIHIPYAVDSVKCSDSLAVTEYDQEELIDEIVVIRSNGEYLAALGDDHLGMISLSGDFSEQSVRWRVTRDNPASSVYLEAVGLADQGGSPRQWLDGEADDTLLPLPPGTDFNRTEPDNEWNLIYDGSGFLIESDATPSFLTSAPTGEVTQELAATTQWVIQRCVNPAVDAGYESGTWLHCYDTRAPGPCIDFTPLALHPDGSRYSGRLFFYRDPAPKGGGEVVKRAVCSTGYSEPFTQSSADVVRINCVDLDTGDPNTLGHAMTALANDIDDSTAVSNPVTHRPGAWGDPHYNSFTNRLFYPTEHETSMIFCWDFTTDGQCGEYEGRTRPRTGGPGNLTKDYGFISIDDCVFGFGHESYFWAFRADDIGEPCVGAKSSTVLRPCPCTGGEQRWGILDFRDLDLTDFEVLNVAITTNPDYPNVPGTRIGEVREIKELAQDKRVVKIDELGIPDDLESVRIVVYVEAEDDPFDYTTPTFDILFPVRPQLVD